jgi:hypothetical protein
MAVRARCPLRGQASVLLAVELVASSRVQFILPFAVMSPTLRFLALSLTLAILSGPVHSQQVLWSVEQSTLVQTGQGANLRFAFRTPGGSFASQGVAAGAALFEGERSGDQVSGVAWAFRPGCPAESYEAVGSFSADGATLRVSGREPAKDGACKVISFQDRTLVITKGSAVASAPPPPPPPPVVAPTFTPAPAPVDPKRSYWAHNGSTIYLLVNGNARELYYDKPKAGLNTVGVQPGSLLFRGTYSAGNYAGTAFRFNRQCGPLAYQVSGPVTNDFEAITLYGQAPVVDASCRITKYVADKLEFALCVKTLPPGAVALLCPQ